jgi:hypothetical protein
MEIYIVLHKDYEDNKVTVLDVYKDEDKASDRVGFERAISDENVWYQQETLNLSNYSV